MLSHFGGTWQGLSYAAASNDSGRTFARPVLTDRASSVNDTYYYAYST
jgi:hypothetical protein